MLSNSIILYFSSKRPIPVYTMVYLITVAASGAGPFMTAGQLCPSAGLTGSVSDSHFAISYSGIIMMGRRYRKMNTI